MKKLLILNLSILFLCAGMQIEKIYSLDDIRSPGLRKKGAESECFWRCAPGEPSIGGVAERVKCMNLCQKCIQDRCSSEIYSGSTDLSFINCGEKCGDEIKASFDKKK